MRQVLQVICSFTIPDGNAQLRAEVHQEPDLSFDVTDVLKSLYETYKDFNVKINIVVEQSKET